MIVPPGRRDHINKTKLPDDMTLWQKKDLRIYAQKLERDNTDFSMFFMQTAEMMKMMAERTAKIKEIIAKTPGNSEVLSKVLEELNEMNRIAVSMSNGE